MANSPCSVAQPKQVGRTQAHTPSSYGIFHQALEAVVANIQEPRTTVQLARFGQNQLLSQSGVDRQGQVHLVLR